MKFINKKFIFITLFTILYLCVGLVSTIHAFSFFSLANEPVLGAILAVTFEVGQAAVLFNLLTSPSQRKKIMPWALMCLLTAVQVLGNIFSSYKYLITHSSNDLRYFKEPIFAWTDLPDQQCNVIITYIVGAILPVVSLCLTEMVVSYLNSEDNIIQQNNDSNKSNIIETTQPVTTTVEPIINTTPVKTQAPTITTQIPTTTEQPLFTTEDIQKVNDQLVKQYNEKNNVITADTEKAVDEMIQGPINQNFEKPKHQSHFINI